MFISAIPLSSLISTHGPVLFIIQTITFQLHTIKCWGWIFFIVLKIISTEKFSHCLRCLQIHILLWLCKLRLTHSQGENNTGLFTTTGNKLNCLRAPLTPVQVYVPSKQKVRCECCAMMSPQTHGKINYKETPSSSPLSLSHYRCNLLTHRKSMKTSGANLDHLMSIWPWPLPITHTKAYTHTYTLT